MKKFLWFVTMISFSSLYAQEVPYNKVDFEKIRKAISDSSSLLYYPRMMGRLKHNDTTLTLEEYRHLYYGYTFQDQYEPRWHSRQSEILNSYYAKDSLNSADCDSIIKYAKLSIEENPFDLRQIKMLAFAYHLKEDETMSVKIYLNRIGLIDAILSSGDGRECESGFTVISTSHEYEILQVYNLEMKKQSLSKDWHCDHLTIETPSHKTDDIYFDIWRLMQVDIERYKKRVAPQSIVPK